MKWRIWHITKAFKDPVLRSTVSGCHSLPWPRLFDEWSSKTHKHPQKRKTLREPTFWGCENQNVDRLWGHRLFDSEGQEYRFWWKLERGFWAQALKSRFRWSFLFFPPKSVPGALLSCFHSLPAKKRATKALIFNIQLTGSLSALVMCFPCTKLKKCTLNVTIWAQSVRNQWKL